MRRSVFVSWWGVVLAGTSGAATPTFQHDVLPLFEQRCNSCHSAKPSAGLDLRTLASVMTGGASGKVVEPGKPDASVLWKKIDSGAMPMGGKPLSAEEKSLVREWIEKGQFPSPEAPASESRITDEARKFWSFQKPVKAPMPRIVHRDRIRTPIDAFILAKLEAKKMALNPEASREKLIRRAYFDLIGLPPTPDEVQAFVKDKSPHAYETVVDRLLASPRYGERWARHWLDVAGYADGNGYLGDEPRTEAWRYRDWVIRALNNDKPYNDFLVEQLAGDQIADWRMGERLSPEAIQKLTATGFLRLTPDGSDNQTIYEIDKQYDALHAVTEVSIKAVMGMNLNCARCHDHKFDPVLQKDYYRIMALFRPVYDPDDTFPAKQSHWLAANIGSGEWPSRYIPNATAAELDNYARLQKSGDRRALFQMYGAARDRWRKAQFEKLEEPLRSELLKASDTPEKDRDESQRKLLKEYGEKFQIEDDKLAAIDPALAKIKAQEDAADEKRKAAKPPMIWAAWDVSKQPDTRVLVRGDFETPGEPVAPGVPLILDDPKNPFRVPELPADSPHTGRRLAFARWLTRPDHPLTARVIVNRVWQYHFGAGIVTTPDDFGSQGARPTHPELLDWLAVSFVEHGWSLKWLHREIMLSGVYRQSSAVDKAKFDLDQPNKLLGRWGARRLEAEAVRDAVLSVSGQLNLKMYGEPIALCTAPDGNYLPDTSGRIDGEKIRGFSFNPLPCKQPKQPLQESRQPNRRSIYLQSRRVAVAGFLVAFDAPLMDTNVSARFRAAAPQQALAALHNPLMLESARKLAERATAERGSDRIAQIRRAIELTYSRPASEAEVSFAFAEIQKQKDPELGVRLFCQALLGSNEFLYID
jgi:hypothetical protein